MKTIAYEDLKDCFAVPGETCIDFVNPLTGKTAIYGKTLDEVQLEYPSAVKMSFDEFCASKAAKQDAPVIWEETTAEKFDEMLNVLPPVGWVSGKGFLVGEPWDHHAATGRPRYAAFRQQGEKFYTASRPMQKLEFLKSLETPIA